MSTEQKPKGRPPRPMPPRIDASPEEIARVALQVPFKKNWRYMDEEVEMVRGEGDGSS